MVANRQPPKKGTIQDLINGLLDRGYNDKVQPVLNSIARSTNAGLIQQRLKELDAEVARLLEADEKLKPDNAVLRALLADLDDTMKNNSRKVDAAAEAVQETGMKAAATIQRQLALPGMTDQQLARIGIVWNKPDPEAVARLIQYASSPAWTDMIAKYGTNVTDTVFNQAVRGIAEGWSPLRTANAVRNLTENMPGYTANALMRTLQLTSYRDATAASQNANISIVDQVIRIAALDDRTCFPAGTMIETSAGLKPIEVIQVGDEVLTHTGKFRRVNTLMKKPYKGMANRIQSNCAEMECTDDHPVLVERGGKRDWIAAKDCRVGDTIFISPQHLQNNVQHGDGNFPVKGNISHANNPVTLTDQTRVLPLVRIGAGMPINPIDFQSNIQSGQVKINRVAINPRLLLEWLIKRLQTKAHVALWFCLACIFAIAARVTKLLMSSTGADTKGLATGEALIDYGRATAFFRTINMIFPFGSKWLAAPFAVDVSCVDRPASCTANCVPVCIGEGHGERLATHRTNLRNAMGNVFTSETAIAKVFFGDFRRAQYKRFAAYLTHKRNPFSLTNPPASRTAISTNIRATSQILEVEFEGVATDGAGSFFHDIIISNSPSKVAYEVYNFEVEIDHSYVANGIVVHNCLSCIALHGTVVWDSEKDGGTPINRVDDHYNGRCTCIVQVKGRPPFNIQTGEDWFNNLSTSRQFEQDSFAKSPAKFEAFKNGSVTLADFVHQHDDAIFGSMLREASLSDALKRADVFYSAPGNLDRVATLDGFVDRDTGSPGSTAESLNAFLDNSRGPLAQQLLDAEMGLTTLDFDTGAVAVDPDAVKEAAKRFVQESQNIQYGKDYLLDLVQEQAAANGVAGILIPTYPALLGGTADQQRAAR